MPKASKTAKPAKPQVPAKLSLDIPLELAAHLDRISKARGTDVGTLIKVALANLSARHRVLDLNSRLGFGKYAEFSAEHVIRCDPGYMRWALEHTDRVELSEHCLALLDAMERTAV